MNISGDTLPPSSRFYFGCHGS